MYVLTGFYNFEEDTRHFTENEREAALAITQRWYSMKRYPTLYHYTDNGPKIIYSWRNSQRKVAA